MAGIVRLALAGNWDSSIPVLFYARNYILGKDAPGEARKERERIWTEGEQENLNMLKGMEKLEGQEREECRDNLYVIACAAEEDGFVKGFRYASWLFAECMRDGFTED